MKRSLGLFLFFTIFPNGICEPRAQARTEQVDSAKLPEATQKNFESANEAIARKAYRDAAKEIQEAATLMRTEGDRSKGEAQNALAKSSEELSNVADRLNQEAAPSEQNVKATFARAQQALAVEHHAKAASAWADRQGQRTAKELELSADALENAAAWSGHKLSASSKTALQDIDDAIKDVADGGRAADKKVGAAVTKMGTEVKELGRKLSGSGNT
jgi:hypothetical protein